MDMVILGTINGFYGVKGWVKLFSYTNPREQILNYPTIYIRPPKKTSENHRQWQAFSVSQTQVQGPHVIAQLQGVDTKEAAAPYLGYQIAVPRSELPPLPEGEYYWQDLIGLTVHDANKQMIGTVVRLMETGANDVLVVRPTRDSIAVDKQGEILIPFTPDQHVLSVDLQNNLIVVDWDPNF